MKKLKINFGKYSLILTALAVLLTAADLILKWCEETFKWKFNVIPGLISVEYGHRNSGAAFSFLANAEWGQAFLVGLTVVMLLALVATFIVMPDKYRLSKFAIALIISGAVGNMVDRIRFGNVRDFVWVNIFGNNACCNFADFWIVFGGIIIILDMLFLAEYAIIPLTKKAKEAQKQENEDSDK